MIKNIKRDSNGRIPQIWDVDSALEDAKKYKTKKEFRTLSPSAYQLLVRKKKIHLVNLPGKRHRLSDWDIICSIMKSSSWGELRTRYPKEYSAFHKRKSEHLVLCSKKLGLSKTAKRWNKESIKKEAKKYTSRSSFSSGSSGAYSAAVDLGIVDYVCSDMPSLTSDFNVVYVWTAKEINIKKEKIVKVGVTSKRLGLLRISFVEKVSGLNASEIILKEDKFALKKEMKIKNIGIPERLGVFSGSTEFRRVTENEYKKILEIINDQ